jgi:hypothetical protein
VLKTAALRVDSLCLPVVDPVEAFQTASRLFHPVCQASTTVKGSPLSRKQRLSRPAENRQRAIKESREVSPCGPLGPVIDKNNVAGPKTEGKAPIVLFSLFLPNAVFLRMRKDFHGSPPCEAQKDGTFLSRSC